MPRDDAVCSTQDAVKCQKCGQLLEPWEAGRCDGCGAMNVKTAEVLAAVSDFLCDAGQWGNACSYLHDKGFSPLQIAEAFNEVSKDAKVTGRLKASDCE